MKKPPELNSSLKSLLSALPVRQREVLEKRYGLFTQEALTLADIGNGFSPTITRERVRQIENLAIADVRERFRAKTDLVSYVKELIAQLQENGGVRREDQLVEDTGVVTAQRAVMANRITFLFDVSGAAGMYRATNDFHQYWFVNEKAQNAAQGFINAMTNALQSRKGTMVSKDEFQNLFNTAAQKFSLTGAVAMNYASLSKRFAQNVFGDFGLAEWPEVNPQTSRDWAYLVLKKENKPLHFTDIAKAISNVRSAKKTHPQTVHNELIKDDRFVLVGRGTYGLKEFGILPGTAREVIAHFLKSHGPMTARDIVRVVLQKRQFKENTLLLNLQNRKFFKRNDNGQYSTLA